MIRLAREPGKRESRYMHLFCGEVDEAIAAADELPAASGDLQARVEMLETEVAELKQRLDSLLAHRETNVNKLRIGVVGLGGIAQRPGYPCWAPPRTGRCKAPFHLRAIKHSVSVIPADTLRGFTEESGANLRRGFRPFQHRDALCGRQ